MPNPGKWRSIKDRILWTIKVHRKDNPIGSKQLEAGCDIKGHEVRNAIRELRQSGELIGSISLKDEGRGGYYSIATWEEFMQTEHHILSRIQSMMKTLARMRKSAQRKLRTQDSQPEAVYDRQLELIEKAS